MSCTVAEICAVMEELAPLELAMEWDNVGLQLGSAAQEVNGVLVTLTVTPEVAQRAIKERVNLIIAHHPLIFKPLSQIRTDTPQGQLLSLLLKHDLAVYAAHTNLDVAAQGLNAWLARQVGLEQVEVLVPGINPEVGLGRVGQIGPLSLGELARNLEARWQLPVRMVGDPEQVVSRAAVVGGSGGSCVQQAKAKGAQVLITGDVSYHHALDAQALGLAVLDAGHFATEQVMVQEVAAYLHKRFGAKLQVIAETSSNPFRF